MPQTTAGDDAYALRQARAQLIRAERKRQGLSQERALKVINYHLATAGHRAIGRGHFAYIDQGKRPMTDALLRAAAAALGIREAELRNPFVDLGAKAA
jgi:transcriptional regulator with XRE-family HTH domain